MSGDLQSLFRARRAGLAVRHPLTDSRSYVSSDSKSDSSPNPIDEPDRCPDTSPNPGTHPGTYPGPGHISPDLDTHPDPNC